MQYMYLEEFCKKWNGRIVVLIFSIALREGSPYTLHICNASETHTRRHYNWQTKSNNNSCSALQAYLTMTFTDIVVQQSFHSRLREHEQLTRKSIFSQQTRARASSVPLKSIPSTCYNVPVQYIPRLAERILLAFQPLQDSRPPLFWTTLVSQQEYHSCLRRSKPPPLSTVLYRTAISTRNPN
jgi:hypothetical protein